MKQAIVIFIAAIILVSSMSNALLVVQFKLNQANIERLYCVNKAKPQKQCHGKCHLKKQLVENNEHGNQSSPLAQLEEVFKINFFHQTIASDITSFLEGIAVPTPVGNISPLSRLFGKSVFQPPDNQQTV